MTQEEFDIKYRSKTYIGNNLYLSFDFVREEIVLEKINNPHNEPKISQIAFTGMQLKKILDYKNDLIHDKGKIE